MSTTKVTRVFHVLRRFSQSDWGGSESVVLNLADHLERNDIESPVLSTSMLSTTGYEKIGRVSVCRFPYIFPWFGLTAAAKQKLVLKGGSPLCMKMLFYLLKQKNISLLHAHTEHRLGGIVRTVARWHKIPYIVTLHGGKLTLSREQAEVMQAPFAGKWEWGKIFGALLGSRRVLKDAAAIICVGRDEYSLMQEKYPDKKIVYQANGVNTQFFQKHYDGDFRQRYAIEPTRRLITCISRIDPQKNQLLLLKTFAALIEKGQDLHLALIGPVSVESYQQEIDDFITDQKLEERVTVIAGFAADDPSLAQAYQAADLFVLPSRHEPFGIVILEAWAAGTPVIAADVGGIIDFTDNGKDILLFKDNDQKHLTEQICRLLTDDELKESMVNAATEKVQQYDWGHIAAQTEELYRKVIEEYNP